MLSEWWSDVRYRLRAVFRRAEMERDLDAEIRDHLEREVERLQRAGLARAEAMRRARLAFGGVEHIKELSRDSRGLAALDAVMQDVRYAWRSLRRRPGLVIAVSLTLALGLGANAAMFGIIDRLLLRSPLYLRDPGSVNRVYLAWRLRPEDAWTTAPNRPDAPHVYFQYRRFRDLTRWTTAFTQTAAFASDQLPVGTGQAAREVRVSAVSASFFSLFDAPPVIGRYFTAQEDTTPQGAAVVVLSDAFWRSQYGGRANVLGTRLQIGPVQFTVIGVAPPQFFGVGDAEETAEPYIRYGEPPSVFVPITTFAEAIGTTIGWFSDYCNYVTTYCNNWLQMIVRRRPGVSPAAASRDLTSAFQRSYGAERSEKAARNDWGWNRDLPPIEFARPRVIAGPVVAERGPLESATARVATWVTGVALAVLLIACANVTNLLLANAQKRRSEIALRLAMGVSQRRLVGQLLVESLLLATIGGIGALAVAQFGGTVLTSLFLPAGAGFDVLSEPRTIFVGVAAMLVAGVVTGLVPALHARRTDVIDALKGGGRGGSTDRSRARAILLMVQGALSFVLLIGAGLFIRSMERVHAVRLGYDVDPVLYANVMPRGAKWDSATRRGLARRMMEAATTIPGVADVAQTFGVPFIDSPGDSLFVPGLADVNHLANFDLQAVSPEFFPTVGTRIVRGRGFTRDDAARAPRVAVVSEALAQLLWSGQNAIGKRIQIGSDTMPYITVVGIAENTRQESLTSTDRQLQYYVPFDQHWLPETVKFFIRTQGQAGAYESAVRRAWQPLIPATAYLSLTPMREILDPQVRSWRLGTVLFLAFGVLALVVAAVGLYSVISYDVARRTHELGVRIALGARMRHVLRVVAVDSARFAAVGVVVGTVIALASAPLIAPLLFAESPRDPVVFGAVIITLAAAVIAATVSPALRALQIDPGTALRAE